MLGIRGVYYRFGGVKSYVGKNILGERAGDCVACHVFGVSRRNLEHTI